MKKLDLILLVDDDEVSNFITARFLRLSGVMEKLEILKSGLEAKSFIADSTSPKPDLILLDLNMPLMNGFEFLAFYEKEGLTGQSKIVILTSSTRPSEKERCLKFKDVVGFIEKPLTDEKIENLVESFA